MFCKKCGTEIPQGNTFCGKCGTAINSDKSKNKTALILVSCVAVIALACAVVFGIKLATGNNENQPTESSTVEAVTTTQTTTAAPTTAPTTKAPTTREQTKPATTKKEVTEPANKYPFDIYMIAAGGLEAIYENVVSPSSVTIEKIVYDPNLDADPYMDNEVQLYCTYINKTGGLTAIKCYVSLFDVEPAKMGQDAAYKLGDSLYANCYVLDDSSDTSHNSTYKKMDIDKVIKTHSSVDWGSRKVFYMDYYY